MRLPFFQRKKSSVEQSEANNLAKDNAATVGSLEARLHRLEAELKRRTVYIGNYTALTRLAKGPKIYVDTRDIGISSHLMLEGRWEPWIEAVLMKRVKPGMKVCDIGANFGYYTLLMSQAVGPQGRVYSFEVNARMIELLNKSIRVNGFEDRVTLFDIAAWDKDEFLSFTFDENNSGGGRVHVPGVGAKANPERVRAQRIDTLIEGNVDVIKIDIEGAEEKALAGMERTISSSRSLQIVTEFYARSFVDPVAFLSSFASQGFFIREITPQGLTQVHDPSEIVELLSNRLGYLLLSRE